MTDPISDMLTRIRNAQRMQHSEVTIPHSKVKFELGKILQKEGFIEDIKVEEKKPQSDMKITLKYVSGKPVIKSLKRISTPGKRIYRTYDKLAWVLEGMGCTIVSTSKGLMVDKDARKKKLGGEVICEVY